MSKTNERIETMETELVEDYDVVELEEPGSGKGSGLGLFLGIVTIGGAVAFGAKLIWDKTKTWREDRTLAKADKIRDRRNAEAMENEDYEEEVVEAE